MAYTQTDIENLEKAIAQGALTVEIDGERVTYRSVDQLQQALSHVKASIATSSASLNRQTFATHRRD